MPLVKCKFCNDRIRNNQIELHLKRCVNYRRALAKSTKEDLQKADLFVSNTDSNKSKSKVIPIKGANKEAKKTKARILKKDK